MAKQTERMQKIDSWYPSAEAILRTQREQAVKSREAAAVFASQKAGRTSSWWWRLLHRHSF